jgi:hypothetical protein
MRRVGEYVWARHCQFGARCHRVDLRAARQLELVHGVERLLDGGSAGEQAVIAHNQGIMRPKIPHDALALAEIDRRTFVVVQANMADEAHRRL